MTRAPRPTQYFYTSPQISDSSASRTATTVLAPQLQIGFTDAMQEVKGEQEP